MGKRKRRIVTPLGPTESGQRAYTITLPDEPVARVLRSGGLRPYCDTCRREECRHVEALNVWIFGPSASKPQAQDATK